MAEFPRLPLWTDAYLGDTTHLTTIEHGAYLLLLISMWRSKGTRLPNDDRLLARYAKLTPAQWARIRPVIMAFFTVDGAWVTQRRLTEEAAAVRRYHRQQSDRARLKHLKNNGARPATAVPEGCLPVPVPIPDPEVPREGTSGERAPAPADPADPPPKPARKPAQKPDVALPDDWAPSEKNIDDAEARHFSPEEIDHEAHQFRDYHLARGTRFRDSDAAWRTWLGKAHRGRPNGGVARSGSPGGGGPGSSIASIVAWRHARNAY